ncbi:hypothetical protein TNCV_2917761, partial [Trichonephila clavipes]
MLEFVLQGFADASGSGLRSCRVYPTVFSSQRCCQNIDQAETKADQNGQEQRVLAEIKAYKLVEDSEWTSLAGFLSAEGYRNGEVYTTWKRHPFGGLWEASVKSIKVPSWEEF